MRRLSKREQALIYIAVLLLVFYTGGILLDLPARVQRREKEARLERIQAEWDTHQRKLDREEGLREVYEEKRMALKPEFDRYEEIASETGLEMYVLSCLDRAGLKPITTKLNFLNGEYTGEIRLEAEGGRDGALKLLDCLGENPMLSVETCSLIPREETGYQLWQVRVTIQCRLPDLWRKMSPLFEEEG